MYLKNLCLKITFLKNLDTFLFLLFYSKSSCSKNIAKQSIDLSTKRDNSSRFEITKSLENDPSLVRSFISNYIDEYFTKHIVALAKQPSFLLRSRSHGGNSVSRVVKQPRGTWNGHPRCKSRARPPAASHGATIKRKNPVKPCINVSHGRGIDVAPTRTLHDGGRRDAEITGCQIFHPIPGTSVRRTSLFMADFLGICIPPMFSPLQILYTRLLYEIRAFPSNFWIIKSICRFY